MNEKIRTKSEGTDSQTIGTYDIGARAYQEKYTNMGARIEDIERGFDFVDVEKPFVIEIGPGNGRDALEIIKKAGRYIGVDVSKAMIALAQENVPEGEFIVSDIAHYTFPENVQVIFAFAALLHLDKDNLQQILIKAENALANGGIVYVSLKRRDEYQSEIVHDEHGPRTFYFYTKQDLLDIAPTHLQEVYYDEQEHAGDQWLTIVFKKQTS